MGDTEILAVKDLPCDIVPQLIQRTEDGRKSPAFVMRQSNGKFRYNCSIIDLYDRSAVASLNSDYINTDLAISTLKTAIEKENYPKVILHSDQGVQFTSWEFVNFCKENNITQSMSKAGCPYDTPAARCL